MLKRMLDRALAEPFRVFFLATALFAAVHPLVWTAWLFGAGPDLGALQPAAWHAHEMVFGFAAALVAGFLLTAVPNWTGREVSTPRSVAVLLAAWVAARVLMLTPGGWAAGAVLSAAFFPLLFVIIARPVLATGNRRNYPVLAVLAALSGAGVLVQLAAAGLVALDAAALLRAAVDILLVLMAFIGARILPFFTARRLPDAGVAPSPHLAWVMFGAVVAAALSGWVVPGLFASSMLAGLAGVLMLVLGWRWRPTATLREPMLWILHLGWAWLAVALVLRAIPAVPDTLALHALTMGGLGCLAIGMMSRVALGHSGRAIRADGLMVVSFVLVGAAALARVAYELVPFEAARVVLLAAAVLWSMGFALYVIRFLPVFATPRVVPA